MELKKNKSLIINPGATSTKASIFEGETEIFTENIKHPIEEIQQYKEVADQFEYRKNAILDMVKKHGVSTDEIAIVVGRGGLTRPCESGTYRVDELMLQECRAGIQGKHACNLGAIISDSIAKEIGLECAYIADPGIVDERPEYAKITGHPEFDLDPTREGVIWQPVKSARPTKPSTSSSLTWAVAFRLVFTSTDVALKLTAHSAASVHSRLPAPAPSTPASSSKFASAESTTWQRLRRW